MSPQREATAEPNRRHQVVIIGSGFGGLNAAKKLKRADVDIKLIARTTHHLFQPLLYQVATGIISEGEIAPPTRVVLRNQRNAQVLLGNVTHLGRSPTVTQQVALWCQSPTCTAEGCTRSRRLENDHEIGWAETRRTVLGELDAL